MERDEQPSAQDYESFDERPIIDELTTDNKQTTEPRRNDAGHGWVDEEPRRIRTLIEIMRKAIEGRPRPVPRPSHGKHNALVEGTFTVAKDIPAELRVGLFALASESFHTFIRFSNVLHGDDRRGDAHGMAVKLIGVEGPKLLKRKVGQEEVEDDAQDFVLMDTETFPTGDPAEFELLMRLQPGQSLARRVISFIKLVLFHRPAWRRFRAATGKRISSPLDTAYFSTTPYALGPDKVVKYAAIPRERRSGSDVETEHGLTDAIANRLAPENARVVYDFCVDIQDDPETQPIDDPSISWSAAKAERRKVGEIVIGHQAVDRERPLGENLAFSPWHGLKAHEPLGYLNRARGPVYRRLARFRQARNDVGPLASANNEPGYQDGVTPAFADLYWGPPLAPRGPIARLRAGFNQDLVLLFGLITAIPPLYRLLLGIVERVPALRRWANRRATNHFTAMTPQRPLPLALWTPGSHPVGAQDRVSCRAYVTWPGLADRAFTGRHLPPMDLDRVDILPEEQVVAELFQRPKKGKCEVFTPSARSNALFCFFAQWLSDSFLRTHPKDRRRNTSNHELDLCQIYGLGQESTYMLRERACGRLKSQHIHGVGEMPVYLWDPEANDVDKELGQICFDPILATSFDDRDPPHGRARDLRQFIIDTHDNDDWAVRNGRFEKFYAGGLERANSTLLYSAFNTVFLREHNRLAKALRDRYRIEDDDWLFETARNINNVKYIKILIGDYLNHLTGGGFPIGLEPGFADKCGWYRANRISIEFNLVYRWHSLVPETYVVYGDQGPETLWDRDFRFNNAKVEQHGIEKLIDSAARQRAGLVALHNTPHFLIGAELSSIRFSRQFRLASFNAYRRRWGQKPYRDFDELTGRETPEQRALAKRLSEIYRNEDDEPDIDLVEFPVGLLAEHRSGTAELPKLLSLMVASDAFSHALTNPLLAAYVFGEGSLTELGVEEFEKVRTLADIVAGVSASASPPYASFVYAPREDAADG